MNDIMTTEVGPFLVAGDGYLPPLLTVKNASGEEMLRIEQDTFYVRGVRVEQGEGEAQEVYDAFLRWLRGT